MVSESDLEQRRVQAKSGLWVQIPSATCPFLWHQVVAPWGCRKPQLPLLSGGHRWWRPTSKLLLALPSPSGSCPPEWLGHLSQGHPCWHSTRMPHLTFFPTWTRLGTWAGETEGTVTLCSVTPASVWPRVPELCGRESITALDTHGSRLVTAPPRPHSTTRPSQFCPAHACALQPGVPRDTCLPLTLASRPQAELGPPGPSHWGLAWACVLGRCRGVPQRPGG